MKHGGNIFIHNARYDFSANLNPLGMPESVKQAVIKSSPFWEHYPDPDCTALVQKLSAYEDVPAENIVCGNGADDLIYRITAALRPRNALLCTPTFGEYRKALEEAGCCVKLHFLEEENGFSLTESYLDALTPEMGFAVLCSPNNPTGQSIPVQMLEEIIKRCQDKILLIDGCFLDFTEDGGQQLNAMLQKNVILLKAFTKSYAIPALRIGYALFGNPELAEKVRNTGQFWSVSAPAQAAGIAVLEETSYLHRTRMLIQQERTYLSQELQNSGIKVYPSDANFLLFQSVPELGEYLLREGILIRNCDNFAGLGDGYFRIAVRTHPENEVLISAVRRCLHG